MRFLVAGELIGTAMFVLYVYGCTLYMHVEGGVGGFHGHGLR